MPGRCTWSGIDRADLDQLLDFGDADLAGHRAGRVEVARGLAEHEVAGCVGLPRLDQRHVGLQRGFHHVVLAVELARFLAFGDDRAVAGAGEERRDARAARAQALGQRALRIEFEFQFAGQVLALEFLVLADVGRNHLADLARGQQQAEAEAVDAGVVGDDGQVLRRRNRAAPRSAPRGCRTGRSRRPRGSGRRRRCRQRRAGIGKTAFPAIRSSTRRTPGSAIEAAPCMWASRGTAIGRRARELLGLGWNSLIVLASDRSNSPKFSPVMVSTSSTRFMLSSESRPALENVSSSAMVTARCS